MSAPSDRNAPGRPVPPFRASAPPATGSYDALREEAIYDAVYEDLEAPAAPAVLAWAVAPAPEAVPAAPAAPAVAVSDPFAEAPIAAPALDEPPGAAGDGYADPARFEAPGAFKIGFDSPLREGGERPPALVEPARPVRLLPAVAGAAPPPPPGPPAPPRVQARRAFGERAEVLYRHRRLAAGVFGACVLAGLLAGTLGPKRYEASSVLLLNPSQPAGAQAPLVGTFADLPGLEARKVLNQALILQEAPAIAERTAERLLAAGPALSFAADLGGAPTVEAVAAYLQDHAVSVEPAGEEVDALRVTATSGDAGEAARIAAVYTEEYAALTRETSRERITATRVFLEEQVARSEGELDELEHQIAAYRTAERAVALDAQTQGAIGQIAALQADLDRARIEVRMREATLGSLEREMATLEGRMTHRAASTAGVELVQLDSQITELERVVEQIYLRNPQYRGDPNAHPDLRELERRLDGLRAEKRRLAGELAGDVAASGGVNPGSQGENGEGYVAALRRQIAEQEAALSGARASAGALSGRLGAASGVLTAIPEQARELAQLERDRAAAEQLVLFLTQKLQEARVAEETEFGLAQVVRAPQVPRRPASPNLPLSLALGVVFGALLGIAAAAVKSRTDPRVHTPADLEAHGFTVVGAIPELAEAGGAPVTVEGHRVPPALVSLTRAFSPAGEAFRHLHAGLQGGDAPQALPQVLLVTGPEVGSGKSLVAANLAVAAAQAGRRTLLVDADLRRPSVHAYLGLGAAPALGEGIEAEGLVYWNTVVPGLFALTTREPARAPGDLWSPEQAARLLAGLRTAFDLVVVDAPPGLVAADAALLAPHADAALLVAAAGKTDADALEQVARELSGAGLARIGAVLNRFDPRKSVAYRRTIGYRYATRYAAERTARAPA
jgi:capsular exopolysaccharide synthesis family protein